MGSSWGRGGVGGWEPDHRGAGGSEETSTVEGEGMGEVEVKAGQRVQL